MKTLENHSAVGTPVPIKLSRTQRRKVDTGHRHLPLIRPPQASDQIDQGTFPTAAGPSEGDRFSGLDLKVGQLETDRGRVPRTTQIQCHMPELDHEYVIILVGMMLLTIPSSSELGPLTALMDVRIKGKGSSRGILEAKLRLGSKFRALQPCRIRSGLARKDEIGSGAIEDGWRS